MIPSNLTKILISNFRELLENVIAPKQKRMSSQDHQELTQLLMDKDKELKDNLKVNRQIEVLNSFIAIKSFHKCFSWPLNRERWS